jgi:phospholipid/cholesterol/gamma-HCH transport system substrate-binding protein
VSKELKVGILAVISGTILYLGFNYLKGKDFLSKTNKYYTIYANIDGLKISNPVIVNGFTVGRVSNIQILQDKNNMVLVELDIAENVVLGDSTVATLTNEDFLGSKAILLELGKFTTPAQNGDTIPSGFDKGLSALFERAEPLTDNITVTIGRINDMLIGLEGAGEKVNEALDSFNKTMGHVDSIMLVTVPEFNNVMIKMRSLGDNINKKLDELTPVIDGTKLTLDKINALEIQESLNSLNAFLIESKKLITEINEGNGTVTKLLKEDSLYQNLNQAMIDLDVLLVHFNENPKHFMSPLGKSKKKIEKELSK